MSKSSARTVQPRGACPRLAAPMQTGDGLLARIVLSGPVAIDAFAALCAASRTHGNGLLEISARGSVQVRGLTPASAPLFASSVEALGIEAGGAVPVLAGPLPQEEDAPVTSAELAAEMRAAIAERELVLAPKVSVIVDDGGLSFDSLAADIRLRARPHNRFLVLLGGDAESGPSLGLVAPRDACQLVCDLLQVLAARGPAMRARDVLRNEGLAPFLSAARVTLEPAPARPPLRRLETIGLHRLQDGLCAIGVSPPFGQAQALDLIALLRIARANGARWAATAPQRTLLLGPIGEMTAFALGTAADTLGFVVDARDPRRRVVACAGAPACASGLIPARTLAADIASRLKQGGLAVHVSGCAKGCAHQRPAPLTVIGTPEGGAFVKNGTAYDRPDSFVRAGDVATEAMIAIASEGIDA